MNELRSKTWFSATGKLGFYHRSHTKSEGFPDDLFDGRPVIGIASSWSELAPCNVHLHDLAASVRVGVYEAGGFPLEFPTMGLGETLMRPTAMLYRNLASMEIEELIRANPIDGVVLLTGCDKTTPAAIMGASSVDLPTIVVSGGPMVNGRFRGEVVGSGTDLWRFSEDVRAGVMTPEEFLTSEACVSRSNGHCTTMGTASTMASLAEAMGLQLPGSATVGATDARRKVFAQLAGRRIVEMVKEGLRISDVVDRRSFENAIMTNVAIGGSTNAIIHLLAMAGRLEVKLDLLDFDTIGKKIPTLVNLKPTGEFLMEDLDAAGGIPAVMAELTDFLHLDAMSVTGSNIGELISNAKCWDRNVIKTSSDPLLPPGLGTAVLYGNLAPNGAVIKLSAASQELFDHTGKAIVFDSIEEFNRFAEIDDPTIDASDILVLRYSGPVGYPGMPEVGNLNIPRNLLKKGIRDMIRISDARMSGTSFGSIILHVTPEAAVGGPLALVQNGDRISLNIQARSIELLVDQHELKRRRAEWKQPIYENRGGYVSLYRKHVLGADKGCDFDFLHGSRGDDVPRQST